MKNLRHYYNDLGFNIESFNQESFLAKKKGANFIFLKYTDYYFVKYLKNISVDIIKITHDTSKIIANGDFKLPKVLRLSVPNINTVFICNGDIPKEVIEFAKTRSISIAGGEQDSVFVLDMTKQKMYCAGREFSHISGEAKLIWGNKKEFKTLNGCNRSYTLMQDVFNYIST